MQLIALIDDDLDFTSLVSELLREHGWDVVVCHEESEAVRCVEDARPSLILLDIRMSTRASGWHLLEELRKSKETRDIPVIVCSAAVDDLRARSDWMQERGISALAKPFDIDDLLSLLRALLADPPGQPSSHLCFDRH